MKILVIGLGSMGKRRVRCLQSLSVEKVAGFDMREDRCREARERYGVDTYTEFEKAAASDTYDAFIISVPPAIHHVYMKEALSRRMPFFVEASVVDGGMKEIIAGVKKKGILAAPSATMMFHPAVREIKEMIDEKKLGTISNVLFHSGQYLPDWHTYEKVSDYYVSKKETGGAREIVPFEMTWFTRLFGMPKRVCGMVKKTIDIPGAEKIDDTYNFIMDHGGFLSVITVDVVSRHATRRLLVNGSEKQLRWDWSEGYIEVFDPQGDRWERVSYKKGEAASGYNPNIGEDMYIEEIRHFLSALKGETRYISSLEEDLGVLELLYTIERSHGENRIIPV
jgi:predicted dehydrogenase